MHYAGEDNNLRGTSVESSGTGKKRCKRRMEGNSYKSVVKKAIIYHEQQYFCEETNKRNDEII